MASKTIGLYKCPCCSSVKARVSVSAKGLAVVTCNRCHLQMFTRSELSDQYVRDKILAMLEADQTQVADPAQTAAEIVPQPDKEPAQEPTKKSTFDIY